MMAAVLRNVERPSQAELTALLDGIATSIVWLDADAAVVHLNEPAEDLFGVGRNQALGRSLRELLKANVELEGVVARARASSAQYSRREIPFEAGPGAAPRVLDVTVTPFDPPGRPGGVSRRVLRLLRRPWGKSGRYGSSPPRPRPGPRRSAPRRV